MPRRTTWHHVFTPTVIITVIHGMVLTEGDILIVRSMGGLNQFVPKSRIKSRKKLERSMMLSATQLGLSAQDLADVVAYLRTGK